jgi:dihydroorotate dehydrogenase (NAD+) catalytic subunit
MLLELEISTPYLNAAGTLGYAPPAGWCFPELPGAFITNPVSLSARTPAQNRAALTFPGGYLLHSGLPNPGLKAVIRQHADAWRRSSLPTWVHLLAEHPDEIHSMALMLEEVEGVAALEVGIPPKVEGALALDLLQAAQGELPVIAALPLHLADQTWLADLPGRGLRALTLSAPRGSLPTPAGEVISGRMNGAGIFPLMLAAVKRLQPLGIPLIAGAGVTSPGSAQTLLTHGASAVQLDAALWKPLQ